MKRITVVSLGLVLGLILQLFAVSCAHTHAFSEWTVVKEPTCTERGERTRTCACGEVEREDVRALGHAYTYEYHKDATLTEDGTASGECTVCGDRTSVTATGSAQAFAKALEGKTISILGDSISTYWNMSSGDAADTTNSTIRPGVLYYDQQKIDHFAMQATDTWWGRTAQTLGARVLVNNSWSGSYIKDASTNTVSTPGAYLDRAVQLHDDTGSNSGEEPDIIFVYMGTNDYYKYKSAVGSLDGLTEDAIAQAVQTNKTPTSVAEAYAIMLFKIKTTYENAEIYCLNVLDGPSADEASLTVFNDMIRTLSDRLGATYVDICADSGIRNDASYGDFIPSDDGDGTPNSLHPNKAGMAAIGDVVLQAIVENTKYHPDVTVTN